VELLDGAMDRGWENRLRPKEMESMAASDARQFVSADLDADFARELATVAGGVRERFEE
jgi:hypothetical protein